MRARRTGRIRLALGCVSVLLAGAVAGCGGGSSPSWRAAAHLDRSTAYEDTTSVSCPTAGFCMAVLGSGYAATYDGTTWSQPAALSSAAGQPDSVSCPTAGFCMAVDADDASAFVFRGGTWRAAPGIDDPDPNSRVGMASVSCPSPKFCVAIDNGSRAFMFNGASWSRATAIDPGGRLGTVSCPSASFCAAVDYGPNVVTFNGGSWSKPSAIDPGSYLQAVSCASASFCVAIDRRGKAFTFNGSGWSAPVTALPDGLSMGEGGISWPVVTCPASDFCAAADGGGGNVVTFDGSTWSAPVSVDSKAAGSVHGPVLIFLMSVSCVSAKFCVAGDSVGNAFVRS